MTVLELRRTIVRRCLSQEIMSRVIIEDFPENMFQAKFFLRNCIFWYSLYSWYILCFTMMQKIAHYNAVNVVIHYFVPLGRLILHPLIRQLFGEF